MALSKAFTIAAAEFGMLARSRAFLLGVGLTPLLWWGLIRMQPALASAPEGPKPLAVIDSGGLVYEALLQASVLEPDFKPRLARPGSAGLEALRAGLRQEVAGGTLFAVLEVPEKVLEQADGLSMSYYSSTPTYGRQREWISRVANQRIIEERLKRHGLDPKLVSRLQRLVPVEGERPGQVPAAGKEAPRPGAGAVLAPLLSLFLILMSIMMAAPQMMQAVIEEKMTRTSEVLLGLVTPFELLLGKLMGCTAAAFLVGGLYLGCAAGLAALYGQSGLLAGFHYAYFALFLLLGVLLHGSLYLATGAACSQPKDAAGMVMPLVLLTMAPMITLGRLMQDPAGGLARGLSYFPLTAPFTMLMRLGMQPQPPAWEVALSIACTALGVLACVWVASRVFRVGLLAQGKSASLAQILGWIFKA